MFLVWKETTEAKRFLNQNKTDSCGVMYTETCLLISLLLAPFSSAFFLWLVGFRQEKLRLVEFYYPTRLIWIDCLTFKISKSSIEGNGTFFISVWTISIKSQGAAQSLWSWVLGTQMRNGLSSS